MFVVVGLLFPLLHSLGGTWEGGEMMLLPMLVGLPSFAVAHILAFLALFSDSSASRRAGKWALLLIWGSIALCIGIGIVADTFFPEPQPEMTPHFDP